MSTVNSPPCQVINLSCEGTIKSRLVAILADLDASRELIAAAHVQTALEALERAEPLSHLNPGK